MPGDNRNYNEYIETTAESTQSKIDSAINYATKSDLNDLQSKILGKKVDFKTPDSINHFYRIEGEKIIFQLNPVKDYLDNVLNRLSNMKKQKFGKVSKENNFTGTILAIQIALKAMETDPKNPKKYNIGEINGEYSETTKKAIKQFQRDNNLVWIDGKPGKETIGKLVEIFGKLINNRKEELDREKFLKSDIKEHETKKEKEPSSDSKLGGLETDKEKLDEKKDQKNDIKEQETKKEKKTSPGSELGGLETNTEELGYKNKSTENLDTLNKDKNFNNKKYDDLIIQYAKQYSSNYKIDPALIKIMMYKESRFNPAAFNPRSKATGLMQLTPIAIKEVNRGGIIVHKADNPKQNIEGGIKLLSKYLERFKGNIPLALAAYNWGEWNLGGLIQKTLQRLNIKKETLLTNNELFDKEIKPALPKETRGYINEIVPKYESLHA